MPAQIESAVRRGRAVGDMSLSVAPIATFLAMVCTSAHLLLSSTTVALSMPSSMGRKFVVAAMSAAAPEPLPSKRSFVEQFSLLAGVGSKDGRFATGGG